jgi:hypothetical protein
MIGWCREVTTLWGLLIAGFAGVGGSGVTGFFQSRTFRAQREHERATRFLDERRDTYARFLRLGYGFVNLIEELDSIGQKLASARAEGERGAARTQAIIDLGESIKSTPGDADSVNRRLDELEAERDQILRNIDASGELVALVGIKDTELRSKLDTLTSEANEFYYTLRLVAAIPVRDAAAEIIHQMAGQPNAKASREALRGFEKAARKDLL